MSAQTLLSPEAIAGHVGRLGAEIERDHPDGVVLVAVLKGALLFVADLVRSITDVPVEIDFLAISRYEADSGRVRLLQDVSIDLTDRDVVVVEDIVDTGLTLSYLMKHLQSLGPRRVDVCTLLDRTGRRIVPHEIRYRGIEIDDVYVLGYGLHRADLFRNLPAVVTVEREDLVDRLDEYVHRWYGADSVEPQQAGGRIPRVRRFP